MRGKGVAKKRKAKARPGIDRNCNGEAGKSTGRMAQKSNGSVLLSKAKVMKSEAQLSNGSVLIAEQSQGEAQSRTAKAQHRFEPLSKGKAERSNAMHSNGDVRHRIAKASRDAERQGDGIALVAWIGSGKA